MNEAVGLIYRPDVAFRKKENGTSDIFIDLSHQVIPLGLRILSAQYFKSDNYICGFSNGPGIGTGMVYSRLKKGLQRTCSQR